jgi:hypothetical protein
VIEAVALLGVELPGVTTLEDLRELYDDPEVNIVTTATKAARASVTVHAQVDAEDVRRAFMEQVAQGDRYWWFPRSMQLDPNELIAMDDDTGDLFRIPFTISGRSINFGDPTPVYIEYVDDESAIKEQEKTAASVVKYTKAASRRNRPTQEVMMTPEELRAQLGLAADATDEQVSAAIAAGQAALAASSGADDSDDDGDNTDDSDDTVDTNTEQREPVAASAGQGVTLDPAAFQQLQRDARAGREAREQQVRQSREGFVDAAIKAGKFPPARRDHYLKLMAADESGTRQFIDGLEENVIPVVEAGAASSEETFMGDQSAYDPSWLSDAERARIRAAQEVNA